MIHIIDACDNHPYNSTDSSEAIPPLHMTHSDGLNPIIKRIGSIRPHFGQAVKEYFKQSGINPYLVEVTTEGGGVFWCFEEDFFDEGYG